MQTSYFIARIVGPVFSVVGIGLFASREAYRAVTADYLDHAAMVYFAGVAMLAAGLAILNTHPKWTRDWRSLITLIGWILTVIGVFRIFAPQLVMFVGAVGNNTFLNVAAAFLLVAGGTLTFKGYVADPPHASRKE
jgi:hypothetical protein